MLSKCLPIFLIIAATCGTVRAVSFTVENAGDYAIKRNPSLAAARVRIEEARGKLIGAGRLSNPELEVELAHSIRSDERSALIGITQKFPLTARLRLEKAVSRAELSAAEAEVREVERKLVTDVRLIAVKLLALDLRRSLRETQISNSRDLAKFTAGRAEVGEASTVEASQVDLETRQLETEALMLQTENASLVSELRPLLGLAGAESIEITGTLASPQTNVAAGSLDMRPDYQAAKHNVEAAYQNAALAKANKWEDIGIGLNAEVGREEDAPEGIENESWIGLKVSLPLPFWNKNQGKIHEANATAQRLEKEASALAAQIRAESTGARGEMTALAQVIAELDGNLIPAATLLEERLRNFYTTGQATLPDVLRARTQRISFEAQRIDALRDYNLARVRHSSATGSILPAHSKRKSSTTK